MRKNLTILVAVICGFSLMACEYDDTALWGEVDEIKGRVTDLEAAVERHNNDIVALQTIVNALQKNTYVTDVNTTTDGYTIVFSDGTTATISNGKDGKDGTNAPIISVAKDIDGNYYWTIDGEWLLIDGERVRANGEDGEDGKDGEDGEDGKDAIAPQIRINDNTKEWEISTDGGSTWHSTGVVAEGKDGAAGATGESGTNGDSLFKSVDTSNEEYVVITLADGTELTLARYDITAPLFVIEGASDGVQLEYGMSIELAVTSNNIADYTIISPEGWTVSYALDTLTVTAPAKELCHYDKSGTISIIIVSEQGKSAIVKLDVVAGEWRDSYTLRTLTFEDTDAKFAGYTLYGGAEINTWSDLIDDMQYGGSLTYTDSISDTYYWYDEGNTELFHAFVTPYWQGGHVISNYVIEDYSTLPEGYNGWYELQMANPIGGHNQSSNFAVHNGYSDFFNSQIYDSSLQTLEFADGVERVIDHMWVTNTCYLLNSLTYGDGFNAPATADTWIKIIAYGFNSQDEEVGSAELLLCQNGECITEWKKWDLSPLGKVAKIAFNFSASEDQSGSYGMNCPAYFAYDDVAVRFAERVFE